MATANSVSNIQISPPKEALEKSVSTLTNDLDAANDALKQFKEENRLNSDGMTSKEYFAKVKELTAQRDQLEIDRARAQRDLFVLNQNPDAATDPTLSAPQAPTPVLNDGTGGFRGNAIADEEATTITVSNGITTKTQEFPAQVTPEDDPFERERLEAEQRLNEETPTEQDVIDAEDDPFERERLEAEQRLNEETPTEQAVIDADPSILNRGPSRDDDGNLQPGWEEGEFGDQWVGDGYISAATRARADTEFKSGIAEAAKAKEEAAYKPPAPKDWRVRISLAKSANYLYLDPAAAKGILAPLKATEGVIFPYTPTISVSYNAKYDSQSLTHSNYNIYNYQGSSVSEISITGDFTAQDVAEANYLLAVIHFFKSASKMFYGQDATALKGAPPPLLYLSGYGQYQFDNHPMALTNFAYSLPSDVDYINAYPPGTAKGVTGSELEPYTKPATKSPNTFMGVISNVADRLRGSNLAPGGKSATEPNFKSSSFQSSNEVTRVPTKISIALTFIPIVTRAAISNKFSLADYASGKLLRGSQNPGTGGGIW